MNRPKQPTRRQLLQDAFEAFQQVSSWIPTYLDNAFEYASKAESLVAILEVTDCGSVGGFDHDNPYRTVTGWELYDRFLTVLRKYPIKLTNDCGFTPETLGKYFKTIHDERDRMYHDGELSGS